MDNPERKNRSDRDTGAETQGHDHVHPPADMVTAADLMAGAVVPVRLSLNVTIRPGSRHGRDAARAPKTGRSYRGQSPDTILGRHGRKITEWARRNPDNATMLFSDPWSAVAKAGVELSEVDRDVLKRRVEALLPRDVLPAGVKLVGLKVNVVGEEYDDRKEHGAPRAVELRHAVPKPSKPKRRDEAGESGE